MMKTILKIEAILIISIGLSSCRLNQEFLAAGTDSVLDTHHSVAILPFQVTFSDEYKILMRGRGNNQWQEQERLAGLDLQKNAFNTLAKRADKKKLGITVQDYLTTNKILKRENIRFSELSKIEKSSLAKILEVDAVIWGVSEMRYALRNFGDRNGMHTEMMLFDRNAEQMIWKNNSFQAINSQMDSPQNLAHRAVQNLIVALPYKAPKR